MSVLALGVQRRSSDPLDLGFQAVVSCPPAGAGNRAQVLCQGIPSPPPPSEFAGRSLVPNPGSLCTRSFLRLEHLPTVHIPAFPQVPSWDLASPGHPSLGSSARQMPDIWGLLTLCFSLLCCTVHKLVSPNLSKTASYFLQR